ncbi:MAG: glycosyltransferase family 2 protein [Anaerolineae bacterium]
MVVDTVLLRTVLQILYTISAFGLAVVGLNALILSLIYLAHRREQPDPPPPLEDGSWPPVLVQLPIYNERHVVQRLIRAAALLDYPRDRLMVQLLDDSTDDTTVIAAAAVDEARAAGLRIEHIRRGERTGFKAGALAAGLARSDAPLIAIFDADFVPPPDFLKRLVPYFMADERLGMIQARWAHLNEGCSLLTRAQALALDSHFAIEQTARHRSGLFMNFSGTAGIWRRTCIEESGGWQHDTLSEDIDLSYRAQLLGWRFLYLPEVGVPAEIPPLMMGFKRQQARWATGTVQCLRKLGGRVLRAPIGPWKKLQAMIHLGGYLIHPLMLLTLLLSLPLLLLDGIEALPLAGLGAAMFGPPLQTYLAQRSLYRDPWRRLLAFPLLMLLGAGIAVSNSRAVLRGLSGRPQDFRRTPKFEASQGSSGWAASGYTLPIDGDTWVELGAAAYAAITAAIALGAAPALFPFMMLYALGLAYVALTSIQQSQVARRVRAKGQPLALSDRPSGS